MELVKKTIQALLSNYLNVLLTYTIVLRLNMSKRGKSA